MAQEIKINGFKLTLIEGHEEPRIHDLELAEKLGFERPRTIRQLIERHMERLRRAGEVEIIKMSPPQGGTKTNNYYLNETQATFITSQSKTELALDITMQIIETYVAWRNQLDTEATVDPGHPAHFFSPPKKGVVETHDRYIKASDLPQINEAIAFEYLKNLAKVTTQLVSGDKEFDEKIRRQAALSTAVRLPEIVDKKLNAGLVDNAVKKQRKYLLACMRADAPTLEKVTKDHRTLVRRVKAQDEHINTLNEQMEKLNNRLNLQGKAIARLTEEQTTFKSYVMKRFGVQKKRLDGFKVKMAQTVDNFNLVVKQQFRRKRPNS